MRVRTVAGQRATIEAARLHASVEGWRADPTPDGFVFELEERWTDTSRESWYAREMLRATVIEGRISEISIYCTGDWDQARQAEHAQTRTVLRP